MDFFGRLRNCGQAFGHFRPKADGASHGFGEFRRMRRGQDDALRGRRILLRIALPSEHADGSVRIENILVALLDVVHEAKRFFVAEAAAPDVVANGLQVIVIEIDDAREIARVSHVHGVGNRMPRGARDHVAAAKKFRKHIVSVCRGDKLRRRADRCAWQTARPSGCRSSRWARKKPPEFPADLSCETAGK